MKTLKTILIFTAILIALVLIGKHWSAQDEKILSTTFCWDSNGEHYVAPNEACTH